MHSWLVNLAFLLVECFADKVFLPCMIAKHDPAFLVEFAVALLSPPVFIPIDARGVAGVVAILYCPIGLMPLILAIIVECAIHSNLGELLHVLWHILGECWQGTELSAAGQGDDRSD